MAKRLLLIISLLLIKTSYSQYAQTGDGNVANFNFGPFWSDTTNNYKNRFAFIYPASVLGNLQHGDTIDALEFIRTTGIGLKYGVSQLTIYIGNYSGTDFGTKKISWTGSIANATKVFDADPANYIDSLQRFYRLNFNVNKYKFDTTNGKNLAIYFNYIQNGKQRGRINWWGDNATSVPSYTIFQGRSIFGTTLTDSMQNTLVNHPVMILRYPRAELDIELLQLYTYGKLPVPLGNPDSVRVLARNVGKKNMSNIKIKLQLKGKNNIQDSSVHAILNRYQETFFNLKGLFPAFRGTDSVIATVMNDGYKANNKVFSVRLENENVYSYRDITSSPGAGGIGFNGSTGNFVAKFATNKPKNINQISVNFGFGGRPVRIAIWEQKANGLPGKLVYQTDSFTSSGGTNILNIPNPVKVNGTFFVGVRQLGTNNVAFGYQDEDPVRPNTFFYSAPLADTNWVDFAPNAPFKFLIEPRIQADTDMAVLSIIAPKDSIDRYTVDSIRPSCNIKNVGVNSLLKDSVQIVCQIFYSGSKKYEAIVKDTISAGLQRTINFPKKWGPINFGEHEVLFITKTKNDRVTDNDTQRRMFFVGVKKDVGIQQVFDPSNSNTYEAFIDTTAPIVIVKNYGFDNSAVFTTKCIGVKSGTIIYNQSTSFSLTKLASRIVSFPTYKFLDSGYYNFYFITNLVNDAYTKNDTFLVPIYVNKMYDLKPDSVITPKLFTYYNKTTGFFPSVRVNNVGTTKATNARVNYIITSKYTNKIWKDSFYLDIPPNKKQIAGFINKVIFPVNGIYTIRFFTQYSVDFNKINDTLRTDFYVGYPADYAAISIDKPKAPNDTFAIGGTGFNPEGTFKNFGFLKNTQNINVVCQIFSNSTLFYNKTATQILDSNQQAKVIFNTKFIPFTNGKFRILMYTNYSSEINTKNDSIWSVFYANIDKDAMVLNIDSPALANNYTHTNIPVKIALKNNGKFNLNNVNATVKIYTKNTEIYSQNKLVNISVGQTLSVSFPPMLVTDSGNFKIVSYINQFEDQFLQNDTLIKTLSIIKKSDMVVSTWVNPIKNSILTQNIVPIIVQVKNIGQVDSVAGKVFVIIADSTTGQQLYNDSGTFFKTAPNETYNVSMGNSFEVLKAARFKAIANIVCNDVKQDNNTSIIGFFAQRNSSKTFTKNSIKIYPNPGKNIFIIDSKELLKNIVIYNKIGAKIGFIQTGNTIELQHPSAGIYYIVCEKNGVKWSGVMVVGE